MKRELQGCRILITGASSGTGRCLAEHLMAAGSRVAVAARSGDKLEELVQASAGAAGDEIDVLLIVPGLTRHGLSRHLLRKSGRAQIQFDDGMPPERVAQGILQALRNNRTETVLGRDARWMLRVNRFLPRLVDRLLARRVRRLYAS